MATGPIGAGIDFSVNGVLQALSNLQTTVVGSVVNEIASLVGPYRPAKWSSPPQTFITVPGTPGTSGYNIANSSGNNTSQINAGAIPSVDDSVFTLSVNSDKQNLGISGTPSQMLVFDGVLKIHHKQSATPTEFPVQTGANLSDHIYIKPATVTLEIFMSDCMASYTIGQWTSSISKSVSAYNTMKQLMIARTPLTLTSRLDTYNNMAIIDIEAPDSNATGNSLKATIVFQQLFTAQTTQTNSSSSRQNETGSTQLGSVPTLQVPSTVENNCSVLPPGPNEPVVPGAGDFSSNPL